MTRFELQRRKRRKRKLQQAGAWFTLILVEVLISAIPATVLAAFILPALQSERGYYAVGSEWIFISLIFCGTFYKIHEKVCDKIFEED